jgi:hypothetical protein
MASFSQELKPPSNPEQFTPIPELAQTDLELKEAPRADTARYDQLRDIHTQETEINHAP